jgi:hypothetical protein
MTPRLDLLIGPYLLVGPCLNGPSKRRTIPRAVKIYSAAMKRLVLAVALAVFAAACGGNSTPTAPSIARVGGIWTGPVTQTSVSGGECGGLGFRQSNGVFDRFAASITQSGSSLTAIASSQTWASGKGVGKNDGTHSGPREETQGKTGPDRKLATITEFR